MKSLLELAYPTNFLVPRLIENIHTHAVQPKRNNFYTDVFNVSGCYMNADVKTQQQTDLKSISQHKLEFSINR